MRSNFVVKMLFGVVVSCAAASVALADNTITFNGQVVEQTCDPISAGGNYTVNLDQVVASDFQGLSNATLESISTPFNLELQNCPASASSVTAELYSNSVDSKTGNLLSSTYGSNVQVQVQDSKGIKMGVGDNSTTPAASITNGRASIPLQAKYYVVDSTQVAPGAITVEATYVLRTQ
ncbi:MULTISPECIES: fimbrial protein [Pseudomonas]|uniref:fimbrial protein n=1 Tax=Pseudomonas TaxID=286 RepID=UPI00235E701C|nr:MULTISPECIES: fimbrial protein [Pseudomonas]WJV24462.1 fimbrial protein [Pseudomonas chlororaphis]